MYYEKGDETYRFRFNAKLDELESNNEAEYAALYNGLLLLEEIGIHHMPCVIRGDSQGVLMQLAGEWPCYEPALNRWLDRMEAKIKKLGMKPSYEIISRKENKEADKLASQALLNIIVQSHAKIDE
ncbi:reverse transcriptase-like protein [Bacillus sp. N9]